MNEEKRLRELVAHFRNIPESAVDATTTLTVRSFPNSVRFHRFWAAAEELLGGAIDRHAAPTYGDLISRPAHHPEPTAPTSQPISGGLPIAEIGIDIQSVEELPEADDYRADAFYRATFTPREVAQSLLTDDPRASFAGKFCAKEALLKADRELLGRAFNDIEIETDDVGAPRYRGFAISISHSGNFAVAVAVRTAPHDA